MKVEEYFLKYAAPCADVLYSLRRLDEDTLNRIQNGQVLSKQELEKAFPEAFRRLKKLAEEMSKDYWSFDIIREYFVNGKHNELIDQGDGMYGRVSEDFKQLCKVVKGRIVKIKGRVLTVRINGDEVKVSNRAGEVNLNDVVAIHWKCAVEKL